MENTETISKYELVLILDANASTDEKESTVKDVSGIVEKCGGKIEKNELWMEKQKLSFPIKKKQEGSYYIISFEAEGEALGKMEPMLKLNEKILRFTVVRPE